MKYDYFAMPGVPTKLSLALASGKNVKLKLCKDQDHWEMSYINEKPAFENKEEELTFIWIPDSPKTSNDPPGEWKLMQNGEQVEDFPGIKSRAWSPPLTENIEASYD